MKKLISFDDFKTRNNQLKEGVDEGGIEEIIPEGLPSETEMDSNVDDKIAKIIDFIRDEDEDNIEKLVNYLRDVLLEMEQEGFVDEETTDELDDKHDGDWTGWIEDVINLPDFPEDALNGIMEIIDGSETLEFGQIGGSDDDEDLDEDLDEDAECPDCDGSGVDDDGDECERCEGTGRVYRPDDIPTDI